MSAAAEIADTPGRHSASRLQTWKHRAIVLTAACAAWVGLLSFPVGVAGTELDGSWAQAYGYFLTHHFQAGVDYVFTFGPLGYFYTETYDPALFWATYVWHLVFPLLVVCVLVRASAGYRCTTSRVLLLLAAGVVLPLASSEQPLVRQRDATYMVFIFTTGMLLLHDDVDWLTMVAAAALGAISLVKFSFLLFAGAVVLIAQLGCAKPWAILRSPLVLYAGGLIAAWIAAGQRLANFPAYVANSWEVARSYTDAMALTADPGLAHAAAWTFVALAGVVVLGRQALDRSGICRLAIVAVTAFVAWKAGFVREATGHSNMTFATTLLIAALLPVWFAPRRPHVQSTAVAAAIVLSCGGLLVSSGLVAKWSAGRAAALGTASAWYSNACDLVKPLAMRRRLDGIRSYLEERWILPHIRARVGTATIDGLSYDQGVLLLNHLNYHPRPVIQGYSASNERLLRLNGQFFAGANAPRFILLKLEAIDGRLLMTEDSQALLAIAQRYRPVIVEGGYALLELVPSARVRYEGRLHVVYNGWVSYGQQVDLRKLRGRFLLARVRVRRSLPDRLRSLLYKPIPVYFSLRVQTGGFLEPQLVPALATSDFLLSPYIGSTSDYIGLYRGTPSIRVTSLRVMNATFSLDDRARSIHITILSVDRLPLVSTGPIRR